MRLASTPLTRPAGFAFLHSRRSRHAAAGPGLHIRHEQIVHLLPSSTALYQIGLIMRQSQHKCTQRHIGALRAPPTQQYRLPSKDRIRINLLPGLIQVQNTSCNSMLRSFGCVYVLWCRVCYKGRRHPLSIRFIWYKLLKQQSDHLYHHSPHHLTCHRVPVESWQTCMQCAVGAYARGPSLAQLPGIHRAGISRSPGSPVETRN